ncbi:excalibur calcium-binding domain-containing protein [Kribbella sp.]|uniref:excalibur calcium-binding domain-containing protein n=1 Tax=Kribbella sp. TaxID=1871183 RepID=UPI002D463626|nr:excalibur calcium-binding domain-containing protein [Kribbella sp.]HZX01432.1 excalibur calcium-binding domain-containing protein [Kribbella sp.]
MATFNSPPDWPAPPTPDWQPPPGWKPDASWPAAPAGWAFWLTARGTRARGPRGRYGAESPAKLIAGWGAGAAAFIVLLTAITGNSDAPATGAGTPRPTVTAAGPTVTVPGPTVTAAGPTVTETVPGPTATVTPPPPAPTVTSRPTTTRTTRTTAPVPLAQGTRTTSAPTKTSDPATQSVYYKNCAAVRAAGKAPLYRGQPGYAAHLDRDGDGVACET